MAFNLSNINRKLYFSGNTAANVSFFAILVLPSFLLCILCLLALFVATKINGKIRLLLINIFTANLLRWFAYFFFYLGWPARFILGDHTSCKIYLSLYIMTSSLNFSSRSIFAVNVYLFIKYGEKKLKWYVILPFIITTWIIGTILGVPPYFSEIITLNGFCASAKALSAVYIGTLVFFIIGTLFFLSIEIICFILTVIYMKRNVLEGSTSVKKAFAKLIGYMAVASVLSFINSFLPSLIPLAVGYLTKQQSNLMTFLAIKYTTRVLPNITASATPFAAIILLKPVRDAIKTMGMKVCPCWPKNQKINVTTEEQHPVTRITEGVPLATTNQNPQATTGIQLASIQPAITDKNPTIPGRDEASTEETTL